MRTLRRYSVDSRGAILTRALCIVIVVLGVRIPVAAQTAVVHSASSAPPSLGLANEGFDTHPCSHWIHASDGGGVSAWSSAVRSLRANSAPGPRAFDEFAEEDKDKVSVTRAALSSVILPGAGQWYAGAKGRAAVYLGFEGLSWAALGFFETVGSTKRAEYRTYAQVHAGINPAGKGDEFYRTITFYSSQEEYNGIARLFNPARPYISPNSDSTWQWDSPASRVRFRALRNQSSEAFNRAKFAIGALALNRLIGALDAIRTARAVNRRARMEGADWKIHFKGKPFAHDPSLAFVLSKRF